MAQRIQVLDTETNTLKWVNVAGLAKNITIEDEGEPLVGSATTLNFVGSGVSISGTGSVKTILIGGGGGSVGIVLSDTIGLVHYTGHAPTGSLPSDSVWFIWETTYDTDGSVLSTLSAVDVAWDDRLTEFYS